MPRYNLRNDHELTKKDAEFLVNQAEENRKAALDRGDVSTGKKAGTPTQQRVFFAEKLQDAIDKLKSGNVKISGYKDGKRITKKAVIARLEARKEAILSMNTSDDSVRNNPVRGSGKGNLSRHGINRNRRSAA